jgi:osmoprotectant transport system ATP-binding protein
MPLTLEARDLHHRFGDAVALHGVSLEVPAGTVTALVGESGSGKTTLLRAFNRMVEPHAGTVRVGGADVRSQPAEQLRRQLGYVPQAGGLLPHWTVRRNVALVPTLTDMRNPAAVADEALELVGLPVERFGARLPHQLSGGQRQRVALARALAARQGAVLLDEPFGALDAISRADTHEAFLRVRRQLGFTALLVTHDLAEASRLADTVVVMRAGKVEQHGTIRELRHAPATAYVEALLARAVASSAVLASA